MKHFPLSSLLLALCLGQALLADEVRELVQRSVPFLEKEGVAWMTERKCASCHQVPAMLWSLDRAARAVHQHDTRAAAAGEDAEALAKAAPNGGNLAIPLVKQLTALVAKESIEAARFVHWGATSQDAIDTGLVLQLRAALPLIEADLKRLSAALAALAKKHRKTTQVGRTWLQQALRSEEHTSELQSH